jgi:thiosulfate reductase cytochrome b subunit
VSDELSSPLWLRIWHGVQAFLFAGLISTGLSLHYAGSDWVLIPFPTAIKIHNVCGVLTAVFWVFFVARCLTSGHLTHYIPKEVHLVRSALSLLRYYSVGMFQGDEAPLSAGLRNNQVQQVAYAAVMFIFMPLSVGSGVLLLFPILAPEHALGRPGLWPMAMIHLSMGYLLTLFVIVHIYLATTGETFFALSRGIIFGESQPRAPKP